MTGWRRLAVWLFALALIAQTSGAVADVVREGDWPSDDPKVSLSVQNVPRSEAIRRLADAAGWSVVVQSPSSDPVDVQVQDQSASSVLEILLAEGSWVARRKGTLISISRAPDPEPPSVPPSASAAPAQAPEAPPPVAKRRERAESRGEDRVVTGGSTRVEAGEVVKDLVVLGGKAEVLGTVSGDLGVMGGSAVLRKGARVEGDASVVGGRLQVEDGAEIDGDVGVVGGKLVRGAGAKIGGDVEQRSASFSLDPSGLLGDIGGAITRTALLFVFGAVLLALATRRMESMQNEVGGRPMRSFALGILGFFVSVIALIALSVTIIGIPIAIIGLFLGVFATYAGICAVLSTIGAALIQHKTKNPYIHLAVGSALFMLASAIPWLGGFVTLGIVALGMGAVVATRAGGLLSPRARHDSGPYRTAAT